MRSLKWQFRITKVAVSDDLCCGRQGFDKNIKNTNGRRVSSELGILSFELGIILGFACDFELFNFEWREGKRGGQN